MPDQHSTVSEALHQVFGEEPPSSNWSQAAADAPPELFIAFTRPQGTENADVIEAVEDALSHHNFIRWDIKLSTLIEQMNVLVTSADPKIPDYQRRTGYPRAIDLMQFGDFMRKVTDPRAIARLAILQISQERARAQAKATDAGAAGVAYFISSLMHPGEVELFRVIYKQRFFLIATHQPEAERLDRLENNFRNDGSTKAREDAEHVIRIDSGDRPSEVPDAFAFDVAGDASALNVNDTFHRADLFVGNSQPDYLDIITRWVNQVFGYPWGTPTDDEFGMSIAMQAAVMSAAFGRSVGAALLGQGGTLLAVGWNDPAQPGGGVSKTSSPLKIQEHELHPPVDPSDENRLNAVEEILDRLFDPKWDRFYDDAEWPAEEEISDGQQELRLWLDKMRAAAAGLTRSKAMIRAMPTMRPLATTRIFNLIEFGRSVHAEMEAISAAARRGISTVDATLYVTTFPCHECARNIVAAGISRVVFVEPYGKSMVAELYHDSICNRSVESAPPNGRVIFEPFLGISPARFGDLFARAVRKVGLKDAAASSDPAIKVGSRVKWDKRTSELREPLQNDITSYGRFFEIAKGLAEHAIVGELAETYEETFPSLVRQIRETTSSTVLLNEGGNSNE